jgi:2-C-methyl-D-erythritol 4-phosphate cytidylyltransferase
MLFLPVRIPAIFPAQYFETFAHTVNKYVIIVAGGIGSRMKSDRPKQFLDLAGVPIVVRSIRAFLEHDAASRIIVCVHRNYRQHLEGLIEKSGLKDSEIRITHGGDTRFESVKNGLALIEEDHAVVAIHDAARPLVSQETIRNCFETAIQKGNAIPCVKVNDSLRKINNNINVSMNRNEFRIVQTPQCFLVKKIRSAFFAAEGSAFSDDATVLEATGEQIFLVEGNEENIKITSPHDLLIARAIIADHEQRAHSARA